MRFDHHKISPKFKHMGVWSWNNELLWSKIEVSLNPADCWYWQGAMSPSGAIFGVRKNGHPQMTQARRLVWMSENNEDASQHRITMKCKNQQCLNPQHFELKPNLKLKHIWNLFGADNDN
jgi:hypothetical protein